MSSLALPYTVPTERFAPGAMVLALLTHGLLFALLFFGLRWQNQEPAVIEAELWSAAPQIAAPLPDSVPPAPAPVIEKRPAPRELAAPVKPDIALKRAPEKKQKPTVKPKPETNAKPVSKAETKTPPKPAVADPKPKASSDLERLLADAAKPSNGTNARSAGPSTDESYSRAISTRIRLNLNFPQPPGLTGNPEATFVIEQLPSGEIRSIRKTKSSGLPAFDEAVERAINASSPLPKDRGGRVERSLELVFKLRENS